MPARCRSKRDAHAKESISRTESRCIGFRKHVRLKMRRFAIHRTASTWEYSTASTTMERFGGSQTLYIAILYAKTAIRTTEPSGREKPTPPRSGQPSPGKSNLEQGRPVAILLSESSPNPERIGPHSTRGAQAQSRSDFHNVGPTPKQYDWPSLRKGPPMRKRPRDRGRFHGGRGLNGAERKRRGMGRDGEVCSVSRWGFRSRAPAQSG